MVKRLQVEQFLYFPNVLFNLNNLITLQLDNNNKLV